MNKIKILLSGVGNLKNYIDAVSGMGAIADSECRLQSVTDYDGLILCGGSDVAPDRYREEINGAVDIDYARDEREIALLQKFTEAKKPILGICRGHQLINVFFGGSLYQHLPETKEHRKDGGDAVHNVTAIKGSVLYNLYGESLAVNSSHHQAVKELGEGLVATAYWDKKYVEAAEHTSLPILGVQWHPERMCFDNAREDTVSGAPVFGYFIELCQRVKDASNKGE